MTAYWVNGTPYCAGCVSKEGARPENLGVGVGKCAGCGEQFPDGLHIGYVRTETGRWYVQLPAENQFGFLLADENQEWNYPPCNNWTAVPESEVPADVRERLGWLLEDYVDA